MSVLLLYFLLRKKIDPDGKISSEFKQNREEFALQLKLTRDELSNSILRFNDFIRATLLDNSQNQLERLNMISHNHETLLKTNNEHLNHLIQSNTQGMDNLKRSLELQLQNLRNENQLQLDKMRHTVDEKLQATLEQRLNTSFKQVSDRMDSVNTGIIEMQKMASEVGNLQRVLTTVKSKGVLGEIQLERILSDILTPEQYEKNVKPKKNSNSFVEFAVKLPNKNEENEPLWLPIDAKFPTEDYHRFQDAQEQNNFEAATAAIKNLEIKIKTFARDIRDKYVEPPHTTDFGILFLPTEGLYSEVLRINGLMEYLRRELSIVICGPSTLSAFLNSLQMGFKTLAVEKRSNEVSKLLSAVKTDFSKFGDLLEKTQRKLDDASKQIGEASHRSKQISRKLNRVETIPIEAAAQILQLTTEYEE